MTTPFAVGLLLQLTLKRVKMTQALRKIYLAGRFQQASGRLAETKTPRLRAAESLPAMPCDPRRVHPVGFSGNSGTAAD